MSERVRWSRSRWLAGGAVLLGAGIIAAVAVPLAGEDEGVTPISNRASSTASTSTTATTEPATSSTTTAPPGAALDAATPLSAKGVGPIEAGMTVAEAEAASGLELPIRELTANFPYCAAVQVEAQPDLAVWALPIDADTKDADPHKYVIVQVYISSVGRDRASDRLTVEGVGLGSTDAEVRGAYPGVVDGPPTGRGLDGLYVYPSETPGFAIRFGFDERQQVTSVHVGEVEWVGWSQSCL